MLQRLRALLLPLIAGVSAAAGAQAPNVLYYDSLHDVALALPQSAGTVDGGSEMAFEFSAFGHAFSLDLEPNVPVNTLARQLAAGPGTSAYKGTIRGRPGSWARIVFTAAGPAGMIWDGENLYGIESPADNLSSSGETSIYRAADLYVPPGTMTCGTSSMPLQGDAIFERVVAEAGQTAALTATLNLDMGIVADFEFATLHSADPAGAILTRMNNVDGIFREQVGVRLTIAEMDVFDTASDPFTQSNASDLLDELRTYRGDDAAQRGTGVTHLFTGRNLDDTTVGLAYFGALCSTNFAASLSEARGANGSFLESLIAAHEIGHVFGAPHDAEAGSPCASTSDTFIMAPRLSSADQFSECSLAQMQPEIAGAACLTDINLPNLSLSIVDPGPVEQVDAEFDYALAITNLGGEPAGAARLDVSFDTALEVVGVSASSGTCDPPASTMSCELGDVAGGSSSEVVFTLRSALLGQHAVTAAVSAIDEIQSGNNSISDMITVAVATDLMLTGDSLRIETGQHAQLEVQVENLSSVTATGVELTAQVAAGARPTSASLGGQACTIAGQSVSCALASLAAETGALLSIDISGVSAGTHNVTLTAGAAEPDSNTDDNSIVIGVEVFASAAQGSGGGGGSVGWLTLLCLAGVALRRSRWSLGARFPSSACS